MALRSAAANEAVQRRKEMEITMAVVLGLASMFYVYVAIRWWREAMLIRRGDKRSSSAMVLMFASAPEDDFLSSARRGNQTFAGDNAEAQAAYGRRDVIVMNRKKTRKQDKRVVA
jgi:hypothetical protein